MIKKEIPHVKLPDVEGVEAVFCKLCFATTTFIVGCIYRSPSTDLNVLQSLHVYMQQHVKGTKLILLGDFNLPDINWHTLHHRSPCADILFDIMLSFNLTQIITQPTRVQGSSSNILDLVFLSNHFPTHNAKFEVSTGLSDHKLVLCEVPYQDSLPSSQPTKTYKDYNRADDTSIIDTLSFQLSSFKQLAHDGNTDIEILWHEFKSVVSYCISNYVPLKTKKTHKHNPWITRTVIHAKGKFAESE